MSAIRTARERARAEVTAELKREARRQLGTVGPAALSLRAVARELGMAPSAPYRYFASRDALLTALILDAYGGLGARLEEADAARPADDHRARWRTFCTVVRDWATASPHEYALLYGSPVPGYEAPRDTIEQAARTPFTLLSIVADAEAAGALRPPEASHPIGEELRRQVAVVNERAGRDLTERALLAATLAWAQLFGLISFELGGHLANTFDPADALYAHAVERLGDAIGLA